MNAKAYAGNKKDIFSCVLLPPLIEHRILILKALLGL